MEQSISPLLPEYIRLPVVVFSALAVVLLLLRRRYSLATRFVVVAVTFRFILSAFSEYTFSIVALGLSATAIGSMLICIAGAFVVRSRDVFALPVWPIHCMTLAVILSGIVSENPGGLVDVSAKWVFLTILALATKRALTEDGVSRFFSPLLFAWLTPFTLQFASIALNIYKETEGEESASFIGGYSHESTFSNILFAFLTIVTLAIGVRRGVRAGLVLLAITGLVFANYRTTLLAAIPALMGFIALGATSTFVRRERALISMSLAVFTGLAVWLVAQVYAERFSDFQDLSSEDIFKPVNAFSTADRKVLSGRVFIWSSYIQAYLRGTDLQLLLGFGPDSWEEIFPWYAHNTLVSHLYELGILGVATTVAMWTLLAANSFVGGARAIRWNLFLAHCSFIVMNQATMGHWQIEGQIHYGLLCGVTFFAVLGQSDHPLRKPVLQQLKVWRVSLPNSVKRGSH